MRMLGLVLSLIFSITVKAQNREFEAWTQFQYNRSIHGMISNISPNGARSGAVVASPSRHNPPYFYHWVRDAALVMSSSLDVALSTPDPAIRAYLEKSLLDWVVLERHYQSLPAAAGLGEPKYEVDGTVFTGDWGRPQNDGPALRALTAMKLAKVLWQNRRYDVVGKLIYTPDGAGDSSGHPGLVPKDLDYLVDNWNRPDFDLWEEVMGQHFYTLAVQRKAFLIGSEFAAFMGDRRRARIYAHQATLIEGHLLQHQNTALGIIHQHVEVVRGLPYKSSGLDTATVLAVNHTYGIDRFLDVANPWVLNTMVELDRAFRSTYPLNNTEAPAAIGRYPEDRYFGGHPWFLTTLAFAEHHYKLIDLLSYEDTFDVNPLNINFILRIAPELSGQIQPGDNLSIRSPLMQKFLFALFDQADGYMSRVQYHSSRSGNLDEQYHRVTGFMLSARDLTWSYSAYITAFHSRLLAQERLHRLQPQ